MSSRTDTLSKRASEKLLLKTEACSRPCWPRRMMPLLHGGQALPRALPRARTSQSQTSRRGPNLPMTSLFRRRFFTVSSRMAEGPAVSSTACPSRSSQSTRQSPLSAPLPDNGETVKPLLCMWSHVRVSRSRTSGLSSRHAPSTRAKQLQPPANLSSSSFLSVLLGARTRSEDHLSRAQCFHP
jgi:hypothetical protein